MSDSIPTTPTYLPTIDVRARVVDVQPKSYLRYITVEAINRGANITGTNAAGNLLSDAQDSVLIGEDFHIEFEWDKPLDHSDSSDTGNVTIYGLSEDTANSVGSLFSTIKLSCGYEYAQKENDTLFIADVIDSKFEKEEAGTKLTLQLTANAKQLMIGRKVGFLWAANTNPPEQIASVSLPVNITDFDAEGFVKAFLDFAIQGTSITTYKVEFSQAAKQIMAEKVFRVNYTTSAAGTIKTIFDEVFRPINISWRAVARTANHYDFNFFTKNELQAANTRKDEYTYIISSETGLIGLPYLRTDVVSRNIDESTASNETALNIKQSYGKDGTPKEVKKYNVRRQGVGFKALINTDIEPNSIVDISTNDGSTDGLYRVRNVKFKGSNFAQDWYMEVECDGRVDSTTRRLTIPKATASFE